MFTDQLEGEVKEPSVTKDNPLRMDDVRILYASKTNLCEILSHIFRVLAKKRLAILVALVAGIISVLSLRMTHTCVCELKKIITNLVNINVDILTIDIAILAILISFISLNVKLTKKAKYTLKVQYSIIISNAFLQLLGLVLSLFCGVCSNWVYLYITLLIQLWALYGVFDLLIEVYTLHHALIWKGN